jgi:hypothetical protein
MNEKHQKLMNEFTERINSSYHEMFLELANHAVSLGYSPIRNKTKDFSIDFRNNKLKRTIMKMEEKEQKHDGYQYGERDIPGLRLKYFASIDYSDIFKQGIRNVIEEFEGRYTGCYGCGRCKGKLQGYTYIYSDDRKVFRCGSELISVYNFTYNNIKEMKELMTNQANYYASSNP